MPKAAIVGYSLNVFPAETLADLWRVLENEVLQIKARVFPDEVFPVELRFSERIVRELDCDQISRLKYFFDTHDVWPVSVNAFVMPAFHGERVKERVYLPAWHESDARLQFTKDCVDILSQLGGGSISVPFGALKPVTMEQVAPNILKAGKYAARQDCVIALEPEPGLCVETTAEALEFFRKFPSTGLAATFDLAHQLVQFEDIVESARQLGSRIIKVHISNAAELPALTRFYEDSIYLHQVCGADADGVRRYFSLDWPATSPAGITKFRVHYHLPVFSAEHSTRPEVERFLRTPPAVPLIVETYTWPAGASLVDNICRELEWVRERISLSHT